MVQDRKCATKEAGSQLCWGAMVWTLETLPLSLLTFSFSYANCSPFCCLFLPHMAAWTMTQHLCRKTVGGKTTCPRRHCSYLPGCLLNLSQEALLSTVTYRAIYTSVPGGIALNCYLQACLLSIDLCIWKPKCKSVLCSVRPRFCLQQTSWEALEQFPGRTWRNSSLAVVLSSWLESSHLTQEAKHNFIPSLCIPYLKIRVRQK